MTRKKTLLAAFGIGTGLLLISIVLIIRALQAVPQNLDYEAVHTFYVAGNKVTIETQSYSVATGDNGPAKVIVSAGGIQTMIDSSFDEDLYMDVHPAYTSWQNVDEHPGRDLLIWANGPSDVMTASEFVSSKDGLLHQMKTPIKYSGMFKVELFAPAIDE